MSSYSLTCTVIAVAVLLGAVLHTRHGARRKRAEGELLAHFSPGTDFIGKDLEYIVAKAGPETYFGGMDHGQEVAQWRVGRLVVNAWFLNRRCTNIDVQLPRR